MTDELLNLISDYISHYEITSDIAYQTARLCLADSIGCALLALNHHECIKLLGPVVPGTTVPNGCRIPGTKYVLDPILGAFNIGTMIRWLDYNDTWLAAEWGHPSDNLGGILALADYLSRQNLQVGKSPWKVSELLTAMIKAHEVQGELALMNSFNKVGFDHVILVKVATAGVATKMLGGNQKQISDALSQAWVDAGPLRTYRQEPNTGSRKSWAAGDATSRGVKFAWMTMRGEKGYETPLTAKKWGLYDVLFQGKPFELQRPLESYVMENVLFKISFPAEFHAQTAVECAIKLFPEVKDRLEEIKLIDIETHDSAIRIIDKKGILKNPADRDHCLQYMVAIGLIHGKLVAEDYEDATAQDPRIEALRAKMQVRENSQFSHDYHDPQKRSIANALTIYFNDGSHTKRLAIDYPLGHPKRRQEAIPYLFEKLETNLSTRLTQGRVQQIKDLFLDHNRLLQTPVNELLDLICD